MRPLAALRPAGQLLRPRIICPQNVMIPLDQVPRRANSQRDPPEDIASLSALEAWLANDMRKKMAAEAEAKAAAKAATFSPRDPYMPFRPTPPEELAPITALGPPSRKEKKLEKERRATIQRYPRQVQALYLKPLRRVPTDGVPCCDLQLRSFSIKNVELFADFAVRAAYYCKLPAFGAHPLPKIRELWTVPKSHFIFKKIQENFERVTHRRLIQIKDGHPESIKLWLAFLRKHQYHGVGMKANVWEWSGLDVGEVMDANSHHPGIGKAWDHMADSGKAKTVEKIAEILTQERFNLTGGR